MLELPDVQEDPEQRGALEAAYLGARSFQAWAQSRLAQLPNEADHQTIISAYRSVLDVLETNRAPLAVCFEALSTLFERIFPDGWALETFLALAQVTGRYSECVQVLRETLSRYPGEDDLDIHFGLSQVLSQALGRHEEAMASLRIVLSKSRITSKASRISTLLRQFGEAEERELFCLQRSRLRMIAA